MLVQCADDPLFPGPLFVDKELSSRKGTVEGFASRVKEKKELTGSYNELK